MKMSIRAGLVAAMLAAALPASAQDVSPSHIAAARAAVAAIRATDQYDGILMQAGHALKLELIRKDPNLQDVITSAVDEETLKLASRRADLEREAALAYAKAFTEDELKVMADFYGSPVGQKLLSGGPVVTREIDNAADIWQRGVARDLAVGVNDQLVARLTAPSPAVEGQPVSGEAPKAQ